MKTIYIIGAAILIAACTTHRVRCQGALQPINEPAPIAAVPQEAPMESQP